MVVLYTDSPEKAGEAPMWSEPASASAVEGGQNAPAPAQTETGPSYKGMFKTAQFWILCIAYLAIGIVFYSIMGNMAIFSADHGMDAVGQGTVLSVIFAATAIAMIPGGAICD